MTPEQIDWIFAQTPERLNLYKQRVRDSYRPAYAKWGKEMGNSAWMQVMQGLCVKLNECYSRSERMGFGYDLNLTHLTDLWMAQRGRCSKTGLVMTFESGTVALRNPYRLSVDRIDSTRGYQKNNVRLLTHWANNTLSTWDDELFQNMINHAYEHHRA